MENIKFTINYDGEDIVLDGDCMVSAVGDGDRVAVNIVGKDKSIAPVLLKLNKEYIDSAGKLIRLAFLTSFLDLLTPDDMDAIIGLTDFMRGIES